MSSPTLRKRYKSCDTSPIKRSRSNSRVKLDELHRLLDRTILEHQVSFKRCSYKRRIARHHTIPPYSIL